MILIFKLFFIPLKYGTMNNTEIVKSIVNNDDNSNNDNINNNIVKAIDYVLYRCHFYRYLV